MSSSERNITYQGNSNTSKDIDQKQMSIKEDIKEWAGFQEDMLTAIVKIK